MTEFQPATRALEEMLKRSAAPSNKEDIRAISVEYEGMGSYAFEKQLHTVIISEEESFDFPVIEWCDDDDDKVAKSDDSHYRSLYLSRNANIIPASASSSEDRRRNAPCLMRCQSFLKDLAILGSLSMVCIPYSSSTVERIPTSRIA